MKQPSCQLHHTPAVTSVPRQFRRNLTPVDRLAQTTSPIATRITVAVAPLGYGRPGTFVSSRRATAPTFFHWRPAHGPLGFPLFLRPPGASLLFRLAMRTRARSACLRNSIFGSAREGAPRKCSHRRKPAPEFRHRRARKRRASVGVCRDRCRKHANGMGRIALECAPLRICGGLDQSR